MSKIRKDKIMVKKSENNWRGAGRKPKYGENMVLVQMYMLKEEIPVVKDFLKTMRLAKFGK